MNQIHIYQLTAHLQKTWTFTLHTELINTSDVQKSTFSFLKQRIAIDQTDYHLVLVVNSTFTKHLNYNQDNYV